MEIQGYKMVTVSEARGLIDEIEELIASVWPQYVLEASASGYSLYEPDWYGIYRRWPGLQFALYGSDGSIAIAGNALALAWDADPQDLPQEGWDWVMHQGQIDYHERRPCRTVVALSISVASKFRGLRLSYVAVQAMKELARLHGAKRLIAPVRPSEKSRYPLQPVEVYTTWTREDGLPRDPWLRVHTRLGGSIIKACSRSMVMGGTVSQWEEWLSLPLPDTGNYVHPALLAPLCIDIEKDRGVYVEPNVWMEHPLSQRSSEPFPF